jgi:hypothetical protein
MAPNWTNTQPIGLSELEDNAAKRYKLQSADSLLRDDSIRCCVRGCQHWLAKRKRGVKDPSIYCPEHEISVSPSSTYVYNDYHKNIIIDVPLLDQIKQKKVESHRLTNERSEDALSWNYFVATSQLGGLASVFDLMTGMDLKVEPELYLWGIRITDESPHTWGRLKSTRKSLGEISGIPTEPDIMLRVPGKAIVLIEAKFGSSNSTLVPKKMRPDGVSDFLNKYPGVDGKVDPLNRSWIKKQQFGTIPEQLLRNIIFAQWLAEGQEAPFVVNLVRATDEVDVTERMAAHLSADCPVSFKRCTWEGLFQVPILSSSDAKPLKNYLMNKTNNLAKAFQC